MNEKKIVGRSCTGRTGRRSRLYKNVVVFFLSCFFAQSIMGHMTRMEKKKK
jgi:hypothetical protein